MADFLTNGYLGYCPTITTLHQLPYPTDTFAWLYVDE